MWLGVEQVRIRCAFDQSVPESARDGLCAQLVGQAGELTAYPVALVDDVAPGVRELDETAKELVLDLNGSLGPGTSGDQLLITVQPWRHGGWRGRTTRAFSVPLEWRGAQAVLAGPVPPLSFFLSTPKRGDRPFRPLLKPQESQF